MVEERTLKLNKWVKPATWLFAILALLLLVLLVGVVAILAILLLSDFSSLSTLQPEPKDTSSEIATARATIGLTIATVALAAFTSLLVAGTVIIARYTARTVDHARREFKASTEARELTNTVNSADLTLRLDERFHSDRALRIRHGAATFLLQKRGSPLRISADSNERMGPPTAESNGECHNNISLYCDQAHKYGLNSDLIDIFNYFDLIGYLVEVEAINQEMVWQKFAPWVETYYEVCQQQRMEARRQSPDIWEYLDKLYDGFIRREEEWLTKHQHLYPDGYEEPTEEQQEELRNAWLRMEHVRSHRGSTPVERPIPH